VYEYGGAAKEAVHRLKFRGDRSVAKGVGALLAKRVRAVSGSDVSGTLVAAIPPDPGRTGGLDHSALIAAQLSARLGMEPPVCALRRVRSAPLQRELSRAERMTNLSGVFEADSALVGERSVLLVDDVMTTGATVSEASKALLDGGAERVVVAVFCRTI
jgi:ComF family protein